MKEESLTPEQARVMIAWLRTGEKPWYRPSVGELPRSLTRLLTKGGRVKIGRRG